MYTYLYNRLYVLLLYTETTKVGKSFQTPLRHPFSVALIQIFFNPLIPGGNKMVTHAESCKFV